MAFHLKRFNTVSQLQSPFFRLPLEIRIIIYQLVFSSFGWGGKLHIVKVRDLRYPYVKSGNLVSIPCCSCSDNETDVANRVALGKSGLARGGLFLESCQVCCERGASDQVCCSIEWLLSGRRMYEEAIKVLYSSFEFELHHDAAWEFLTTVSLRNLNYIQKLSLISVVRQTQFGGRTLRKVCGRIFRHEMRAKECCEILRHLKGLRELRIRLFRNSDYNIEEMRILNPLRDLRPQRVFVVELPWIEDGEESGGLVRNGRVSGVGGLKCEVVRRDRTKDNNGKTQYPRPRIFVHYGGVEVFQGLLLLCCFVVCMPVFFGEAFVEYWKDEREYRARKRRMSRERKALS